KGEPATDDALPVRIYVTGAETWRELPAWPPATTPRLRYLGAGGALLAAPPADVEASTRYRYDPADPTPSAGGALLFGAAVVDNRPLEARADVLTFTGPPLDAPLEVAGAPQVVLHVACSID